jgi:hypothetical protein
VATAAKDGRSRLESGRWRLSRSLSARARARIAELDQEIERLQRSEEAIVVATGAPRERGCPPWVGAAALCWSSLANKRLSPLKEATTGDAPPPLHQLLGSNELHVSNRVASFLSATFG